MGDLFGPSFAKASKAQRENRDQNFRLASALFVKAKDTASPLTEAQAMRSAAKVLAAKAAKAKAQPGAPAKPAGNKFRVAPSGGRAGAPAPGAGKKPINAEDAALAAAEEAIAEVNASRGQS
jgi:hypothetical protein